MARTAAIVIEGDNASALKRVTLLTSQAGGGYDEAWLQALIQKHPELLPIDDIEPGFGRLIPVAREVACGHGYIDNLFITADGGIAIVETKLWRNPESRRLVVAQTLDYAAALSRMTYSEFAAAALGGIVEAGRARPTSLYSLVSDDPDALSEDEFIDALAANLRRGRLLAIAAGDGIRSESETLADLLQSHAGSRFTFALVAIELFSFEGRIVAVPRQVAKTTMIERGVVSIKDGVVQIDPPVATDAIAPPRKNRGTLTEDIFMDAMARLDPKLPDHLRAFMARASELGVEPYWQGALNLKWAGWPGGLVNMGAISKEGALWTDPITWKVGGERALPYNAELAAGFGGRVKDVGKGPYLMAIDGKPMRIQTIIPVHTDAWLGAMSNFIDRLKLEAMEND
jgi:hypothetical protein